MNKIEATQSGFGKEKGIRLTILGGFGLVIGLAVLISAWSYYHISVLGTATENLFVANYRSIQYARQMDSAVVEMLELHAKGSDNTLACQHLNSIFLASLQSEYQNITEKGEKNTADAIRSSYQSFYQTLSTSGNTEEVLIKEKATHVFQWTHELLLINERAMFERGDAAKRLSDFARISTLAIMVLLLSTSIYLAIAVSRRSLAEFRELDRAKSNFIATAAHELKNPISSIKTTASILKDRIAGPLTDRQSTMLSNISRESERVLGLVQELLDLARLETGTLALHKQRIDLHSMIESALFTVMVQADQAHVQLDLNIAPSAQTISVDPNKISWAISNLVSNAIRYSPPHSTVTVAASEIDNEIWISITDQGKGIKQEDLSRIFEKFVQVEEAAFGGGIGSGLGLSIAKEIVLAHNGRIWADSEPGKGSIFTLTIPLTNKTS